MSGLEKLNEGTDGMESSPVESYFDDTDSYAEREAAEVYAKEDRDANNEDSFATADQQSGLSDIEPIQDLSGLYELAVDSMQTGVATYADQFEGEDLPVMATFDDVLDQTVEEPFVDYAGDVRTEASLSDLFATLNDIGEEYGVENMAYDAASNAIETYISDIGQDFLSDSMDPLLADMSAGIGMETETTDMFDVEVPSLDADPISSEIFDQQIADFELTEDMGYETADSYMLMSQDSAAIDALRDFHTDMLSYIGRHEVLLDMEDTKDMVSNEYDPPDLSNDPVLNDADLLESKVDYEPADQDLFESGQQTGMDGIDLHEDIAIDKTDTGLYDVDEDASKYDPADILDPQIDQEEDHYDAMQDM